MDKKYIGEFTTKADWLSWITGGGSDVPEYSVARITATDEIIYSTQLLMGTGLSSGDTVRINNTDVPVTVANGRWYVLVEDPITSLDGFMVDKSGASVIHMPTVYPECDTAQMFASTDGTPIYTDAGEYFFPKGMRKIGASAYSYNMLSDLDVYLQTLDIPEGIEEIGDYAFYGALDATAGAGIDWTNFTLNLPDGLTKIGDSAFVECSGLFNINIPDSVTTIGDNAFRGFCTYKNSEGSDAEVVIGSGVTTIGDYAFNTYDPHFSSLTVKATTPPTIGMDIFDRGAEPANIYVPSSSLSAYQSASGWDAYATIISAIPS